MGTAIHPVGAPARDHHRWALSASTLALALVACQVVQPPAVEVDGPIPPLSKLYVANQTDSGHHVRMNWPDGFIQVAWVEAGTTKGLEGAIGTSGFPATIDVLTADCTLVASLPGLPRGSAGIVVITPLETNLRPLEFADASWSTVGSIEACGATPVWLRPGNMPPARVVQARPVGAPMHATPVRHSPRTSVAPVQAPHPR